MSKFKVLGKTNCLYCYKPLDKYDQVNGICSDCLYKDINNLRNNIQSFVDKYKIPINVICKKIDSGVYYVNVFK